jgi:hypothetical protein
MNADATSNLHALTVLRKIGAEPFHAAQQTLPFTLLDFWRWCSSDLANNAMRGVVAEYLVACDLGLADGIRVEWDAYDLKTQEGIKVEVKSAAYLQSWHQEKFSAISFGIQPTIGWDANTNEYGTERRRQADVYVFALLHHQNKQTLDPLDVEQWTFYVLPTMTLNDRVPMQKQISMTTLRSLNPMEVKFGEISAAIQDALRHAGT